MKRDNKQSDWILCLLGLIPVVWLALLVAPALGGGIPEILERLIPLFDDPFDITWCKDSLKAALVFLCAYGMGVGIYLSSRRNYRHGEEHGSAKWGSLSWIHQKYRSKKTPEKNKILTQNAHISLNGFWHRHNLNVLVVGGSGAGKTRFYAKPNLLQANTSFIVLDPKGELVSDTGYLLEQMGYAVKVLDLIHMEKSFGYNPFIYLEDDNDVMRLVTNLFKNTTPKGSQSQDPFWDNAAQSLLLGLVFFLKYEAPEEEQNFAMVLDMIRAGEVREEDENYQSPLDILFDRLEDKHPNHIAVKYYRDYHSGAGKTLKSIQITLATRLQKFNLASLATLTSVDELDLPSIGKEKTALFACIPDNDESFNFIVGMLYTQLFQQLYKLADNSKRRRLPVHVHFVMDEFANVSIPDSFETVLSTMRSREISVSIILQNIAQLKALFEKSWESVIGNCDEFLYLGGNEQSTHKYVSELLGKETINLNTYGRSTGRNGNYSTNYQLSARDLMSPDEVRRLDNRYAILFIRGEHPILDEKYDILKHPNVKWTADGKADGYDHGTTKNAFATVSLTRFESDDKEPTIDISKVEFELLSESDLEALYETEEKHNYENA